MVHFFKITWKWRLFVREMFCQFFILTNKLFFFQKHIYKQFIQRHFILFKEILLKNTMFGWKTYNTLEISRTKSSIHSQADETPTVIVPLSLSLLWWSIGIIFSPWKSWTSFEQECNATLCFFRLYDILLWPFCSFGHKPWDSLFNYLCTIQYVSIVVVSLPQWSDAQNTQLHQALQNLESERASLYSRIDILQVDSSLTMERLSAFEGRTQEFCLG